MGKRKWLIGLSILELFSVLVYFYLIYAIWQYGHGREFYGSRYIQLERLDRPSQEEKSTTELFKGYFQH